MSNNYINRIAESKVKYHRDRSKMTYEEKFKIIVELQKLNFEMRNSNPLKVKKNSNLGVWQVDD